MSSRIYYIRPNKTTQLPVNVMVLDTETEGEPVADVEVHRMILGWTWRMHLDDDQQITREDWREWTHTDDLGAYVASEARAKAPLIVIGSNITFDLFASGLAAWFHVHEWTASIVYDRGMTTIIRLEKGSKRITFLAVQNFLAGGVKAWGELLGLPKLEVDFDQVDRETLSTYCRRDTEITGRAFLEWLRFCQAHDMGGFAHTRASQAFRCWRHRFLTEKVLHYDQVAHNQFVRRAYYGGRVECGQLGRWTGGRLVKLDVNSMYPAVMRDEWYPVKLKQWVRDPSLDYVRKALRTMCVVAEVELDTDEAAYPLRDGGKLLFPHGRFVAHLCTPSLTHALAAGHVVKIRQAMTFTRAKLFTGFVDEWYKLRQRYQAEGNAIYAQNCKLILNSLYGKFGELREKVVVEGDDDENGFYRRECSVPRELVWPEPPRFDWRYDPADYPDTDTVRGIEWAAWGKYQVTAGQEEGPYSMPAIAAHVTDYGRMLLWRYMLAVGHENVVYSDTDSLIVPLETAHRLEEDVDDHRLGALKVEGVSDRFEANGPKDYRFGDETRRKGIRSNATEVEPGRWSQAAFPGLHSLLRDGSLDGFPVGTVVRRSVSRDAYDKGKVQMGGKVTPWIYPRSPRRARRGPETWRDVLAGYGGVRVIDQYRPEWRQLDGRWRGVLSRWGLVSEDRGEPMDTLVEMLETERPELGIRTVDDLVQLLGDPDRVKGSIDQEVFW